jgi:hypothetical protein
LVDGDPLGREEESDIGACWWLGNASVPEWVEGNRNLAAGTPIREQSSDGRLRPLPYVGVTTSADGSAPTSSVRPNGSVPLPKHTYRREKREKELNRQRKREEKQQRKLDRAAARAENPDAAEPATPGAPASER